MVPITINDDNASNALASIVQSLMEQWPYVLLLCFVLLLLVTGFSIAVGVVLRK